MANDKEWLSVVSRLACSSLLKMVCLYIVFNVGFVGLFLLLVKVLYFYVILWPAKRASRRFRLLRSFNKSECIEPFSSEFRKDYKKRMYLEKKNSNQAKNPQN